MELYGPTRTQVMCTVVILRYVATAVGQPRQECSMQSRQLRV